jgi:hypothetical protein
VNGEEAMEAKLVVVGGKANRSEVKLKLPAMLGRGRDVDVTVAHATVSRHHCLIYELDGALVVRDNGSLNGTLVDGKRIKEALLRPGQSLTIGPLTFRAEYDHSGSFPELGAPAPAAAANEEPSGLPVIDTATTSHRETKRSVPPSTAARADEKPKPQEPAAPEPAAESFDFLDDEPAEPPSNAPSLGFLNETDDSAAESADSFDFLDDERPTPPAKPKAVTARVGDSEEVFRLADEPAAPAKKEAKTRGKPSTANGKPAKPADEPLEVNASAGEAAKRGGHDDPALDDFLNSLGLDE